MIEMILGDLPRPVARIVHIGAGTGDDLPACLASGAERILLLEADPDIAAQLAAQTAREPRVEVVAATVSADPRPRPFHRTNFPELDSLRAPAAVLRALLANGLQYAGDPGGYGGLLIEARRAMRGSFPCAHVLAREILPCARARLLTCAVPGCCMSQDAGCFELGAAL